MINTMDPLRRAREYARRQMDTETEQFAVKELAASASNQVESTVDPSQVDIRNT